MIAERNISDPLAIKFIAETANEIKTRFARYFEEGIIEVISPATEWYPDLDAIIPTFNDSQLRTTWRAKQSLDYAFLMLYSKMPNYITGMKTFAESRENWVMLEFCNLGFIGKLFKQSDLYFVTQFILLLYRELPVDWILDQLFVSKYCPRIITTTVILNRLMAKSG
uniref:MGAT4 conserved region domain-containing protein n=1 Tax=Ditylenchus dipsaci TaxID=166011 RepID=A0A915ETU5_9BILA